MTTFRFKTTFSKIAGLKIHLPTALALACLTVCGPAKITPAADARAKSSDGATKPISHWTGMHLGGEDTALLDDESVLATVIVFVKHDCPIANSYLPTLHRIQRDFQSKGIRFLLVYPEPNVTPEIVQQHLAQYSITIPTVLDGDLEIATKLDAKVTPEALVIDPAGKVLYQGRVDDKYVGFGKRRIAPTREDLREALRDVVAERPVDVPKTQPIGCLIPRHMMH